MNTEKPIFLHFLNREALLASGQPIDLTNDLLALDVLTICHCSGMSVNISQMSEYGAGQNALIAKLLALTQSKILVPSSHDPNIDAFIASRQKLYSSVSGRYPMYFANTSTIEKFEIKKTNEFSMTGLLRSNLLAFNPDELPFFAPFARTDDKQLFAKNVDTFQGIAAREQHMPITRANFQQVINKDKISKNALNALGRIVSALYFENYAQKNKLVTCTGITKVGYVENYFHFPHYDIPILINTLKSLGWSVLFQKLPELKHEVYRTYGGSKHRRFVETLNAFLYAVGWHIKRSSNAPLDAEKFDETDRVPLINLVDYVLNTVETNQLDTASSLEQFYEISCERIFKSASKYSEDHPFFKGAWEEQMPPKIKMAFLLLTATDSEDKALYQEIKNRGFSDPKPIQLGSNFGYKFENTSGAEIVHIRSNSGSTGSSGSELISYEAIKEMNPNFVISVGICFGLKKKDQKVGDVLISQEIQDYEKVRLSETDFSERGPRIPASDKLLSAARAVIQTEQNPDKFQVGLMLSGMKLFDSKPERTKLVKRFPDAIGCEMEGTGIMSAGVRKNADWILVKSICDWGYAKKKNQQPLAARNAATFVFDIVDLITTSEPL